MKSISTTRARELRQDILLGRAMARLDYSVPEMMEVTRVAGLRRKVVRHAYYSAR